MLSRTAPRLDTSTLPARPLSLAALAAGLALALVMAGCGKKVDHAEADAAASVEETANVIAMPAAAEPAYQVEPPVNTERYAKIEANPIHRVAEQPVSTFSIDVDTGSYANVRRMLAAGELPPKDAVRVEELVNYFDYGYPRPDSKDTPFKVSTELAPAPWNARHVLMQIGIQGYEVDKEALPPANLVLLIDTSGSMDEPDKLPLLKRAFAQLATQLRAKDRVSIVAYAGSAGLVLAPTAGDRGGEILDALERLQAGGSTNGGEGIQLAYATARQAFIEGGINRVLLATDGDFNVGVSDQSALETLVADQRKSGIALSTLGFGTGNYNDAMAEQLADIGNGNHAYIDSALEAQKVLIEELGSTLMTIAGDVKVQVEFNPAVVAEYRLIGYENRVLKREDFNNDRVDAGEIGAGHDVTALYELALVGSGGESVDPLRYGKDAQAGEAKPAADGASAQGKSDELALLRLRYKRPGENDSRLIETPMLRRGIAAEPSERMRFAAAVAGFGDLLRGGTYVEQNFGWDGVIGLARSARGDDRNGYRGEFLQLAQTARSLQAKGGATKGAAVAEE
ncbi:vWA domain-containing protein [Lysobacter capsici]|uniref:vWA domain-containing protein n=2 Tax=Lysobacter TaxID=68 RepID=UPI001F20E2E0|nr:MULTISPECIES: VWA domain-containing protein [Lysobacter]UJB18470.1 VWA domain-containing protein [Lysobacter capsici]UJQ27805.1 VWA domain-containing protein [Lysobacter gummosus]